MNRTPNEIVCSIFDGFRKEKRLEQDATGGLHVPPTASVLAATSTGASVRDRAVDPPNSRPRIPATSRPQSAATNISTGSAAENIQKLLDSGAQKKESEAAQYRATMQGLSTEYDKLVNQPLYSSNPSANSIVCSVFTNLMAKREHDAEEDLKHEGRTFLTGSGGTKSGDRRFLSNARVEEARARRIHGEALVATAGSSMASIRSPMERVQSKDEGGKIKERPSSPSREEMLHTADLQRQSLRAYVYEQRREAKEVSKSLRSIEADRRLHASFRYQLKDKWRKEREDRSEIERAKSGLRKPASWNEDSSVAARKTRPVSASLLERGPVRSTELRIAFNQKKRRQHDTTTTMNDQSAFGSFFSSVAFGTDSAAADDTQNNGESSKEPIKKVSGCSKRLYDSEQKKNIFNPNQPVKDKITPPGTQFTQSSALRLHDHDIEKRKRTTEKLMQKALAPPPVPKGTTRGFDPNPHRHISSTFLAQLGERLYDTSVSHKKSLMASLKKKYVTRSRSKQERDELLAGNRAHRRQGAQPGAADQTHAEKKAGTGLVVSAEEHADHCMNFYVQRQKVHMQELVAKVTDGDKPSCARFTKTLPEKKRAKRFAALFAHPDQYRAILQDTPTPSLRESQIDWRFPSPPPRRDEEDAWAQACNEDED